MKSSVQAASSPAAIAPLKNPTLTFRTHSKLDHILPPLSRTLNCMPPSLAWMDDCSMLPTGSQLLPSSPRICSQARSQRVVSETQVRVCPLLSTLSSHPEQKPKLLNGLQVVVAMSPWPLLSHSALAAVASLLFLKHAQKTVPSWSLLLFPFV